MADLRLVSGNDNNEHNNGDVVQIWERQPGETSKAFAAFEAYRDMGPQRSLSKVAQS